MIAPHLRSSIDAIRARLALVDRIFGPAEFREPPILPRDLSGFSEPTTPACQRYALGHMPDEDTCVYCQEEGA